MKLQGTDKEKRNIYVWLESIAKGLAISLSRGLGIGTADISMKSLLKILDGASDPVASVAPFATVGPGF